MQFSMERNINYYETDRMGIVHHSNYIRFMEESRIEFMKKMNLPYDMLENNGILIPVLGVSCDYKTHVSFGDTIVIHCYIKNYNGVRLNMQYEMYNKKTGALVLTGETKHCFTNAELKPINLKKNYHNFHKLFADCG